MAVHARDLKQLDASSIAAFQTSVLGKSVAAGYWDSDIEDRFQRAYNLASDAQPFEKVFFVDQTPVYFLRAQIKLGVLSFWGRPARIFRNEKISSSDLRLIHGQLDSNFRELGIETLELRHDDAFAAAFWSERASTQTGFRSLIDLSQSEADLSSSVRKSYKSLINWGRKNLSLTTYDHRTMTPEVMQKFRDFHVRISGRETRSVETWDIQLDMIRSRNGYVVTGFLKEEIVSAVLILHGESDAAYAVAVNDRALMAQGQPIGHWPLMNAIFTAKEMGLKRFDLGPIGEKGQTEKEAGIAKFRKGFSETLNVEVSHTFSLEKPQVSL